MHSRDCQAKPQSYLRLSLPLRHRGERGPRAATSEHTESAFPFPPRIAARLALGIPAPSSTSALTHSPSLASWRAPPGPAESAREKRAGAQPGGLQPPAPPGKFGRWRADQGAAPRLGTSSSPARPGSELTPPSRLSIHGHVGCAASGSANGRPLRPGRVLHCREREIPAAGRLGASSCLASARADGRCSPLLPCRLLLRQSRHTMGMQGPLSLWAQ